MVCRGVGGIGGNHTFNLHLQEAKARESLWIWGQPGLYTASSSQPELPSENLSQKEEKSKE